MSIFVCGDRYLRRSLEGGIFWDILQLNYFHVAFFNFILLQQIFKNFKNKIFVWKDVGSRPIISFIEYIFCVEIDSNPYSD